MNNYQKQVFSLYNECFTQLNSCFEDEKIVFNCLNDSILYSILCKFYNIENFFDLQNGIKQLNRILKHKIFTVDFLEKINIDEIFVILKKIITYFTGDIDINVVEKVLGNILEKYINRKETGSYYTPEDTTKYIVTNSINAAVLNKLPEELRSLLFKKETLEVLNEEFDLVSLSYTLNYFDKQSLGFAIKQLKIIDPTCGSGAFIIAAFNYLNELRLTSLGFEINDIISSLYGVDISPIAIRIIKIRLYISLIVNNAFDYLCIEIIDKNFLVGDSLLGGDYKLSNNLANGFNWTKLGVKFDCIIGNPPYVENKNFVTDNFQTLKCNNLYAYTIERAFNIACNKGVVSFIVPLPLISTSRMQPALDYIKNNSSSAYFSTFADRPGCIFTGVHQRLVIFFAEVSNNNTDCKVYTTSYNFWYKEERKNLFKQLKYNENEFTELPKIGNKIENSIYKKFLLQTSMVGDNLTKEINNGNLFISTRIGFWPKSFILKPSSNEYKELFVKDINNRSILNTLFNSSTFYFYWLLTSDCWHVCKQDYELMPFNISLLNKEDRDKLNALNNELLEDLELNKKYIGSKQVEYEYKHKFSKRIIDDIDEIIGNIYGFTKKEKEYIKNYTLKYRMNDLGENNKRMNVVDLFSGVGGMSVGFEKAGFNIVLANEYDKNIAESYARNHKNTIMINKDIRELSNELDDFVGRVDVIIGGPPCQGFSMAGARIRESHSFLDDPRNYLFRNYFKVVQKLEPKYFVMENVPGMLSMQNGEIISEIEKLFTNETNFDNGRYYLYKKVLNAYDYGVPQERNRLIIFGSKYNLNFEKLFSATKNKLEKLGKIKKVTIYDAISDLNFVESGEGHFEQKYKFEPMTEYQKERRKNSKGLFNHIASNHNAIAMKRMLELKPGDRRLDLEEGESIKSVHSGAYGRMKWDEPSKTIITRFDTPSSGVYVHPERNRTITVREAARLQSFDDDFVFFGNKSSVIKQVGNAVPPLLAYYLANVIISAEENNGG